MLEMFQIYTILSGKKYVQTRDFFDFLVNTPLEYRRFFRKNTPQKQPRKSDVCQTYPSISPVLGMFFFKKGQSLSRGVYFHFKIFT